MKALLVVLLATAGLHAAPEFRAGVSRVKITPPLPVWLAGYAARTHQAESVSADLYAKALALDDGKGGRVVIVTTDLIGLPREVSDAAADRARKRFGLKRSQLLFNSSHTHTGPVVWPNLKVMLDLTDEQQKPLRDYASRLTEQLVEVTGEAIRNLVPVQITYGQGEAGFAINRRAAKLTELNPGKSIPAPVDHSVPVLRVQRKDGSLLAVLFGYACHNTTMTAEFNEVGADYAGFAQTAIERAHPGTTALFLMLCGADQNPDPRSSRELAIKYGNELAQSVERVLSGSMQSVTGPVKTAYKNIDLPLAPHTREQFVAESKNSDVFRQRRARLMLDTYDKGAPTQSVRYPVQVVRFDKLVLVALGGEVVVDFAIRLKREFPETPLIVAGYSNVVMSYIPSERVLKEGGYEGEDAMIYYGLPGKYAAGVEDRIVSAVHALAAQ
jgi:neutral ceramidase